MEGIGILLNQLSCVNCGDTNNFIQDFSSGDFICSNCGVVQPGTMIDTGKEWRDFGDEERSEEKVRAERVDEDFNGLGINISISTSSTGTKSLEKYSKIASATTSKSERNLKQSFKKLNDFTELLQIPALIKQTAKEILKLFEKKRQKNVKGYKKDAFLVAVLLAACKQEQGGYTLKALSKSTNIEEKEIKKYYKILLRDPDIFNVSHKPTEKKEIYSQVADLIEVFCNRLNQPFYVAQEAKEVARSSMGFLEGKRPSSIAAASLLFILQLMNIDHKQQEVAVIANVSTNTLRNVHKELHNHIEQLPSHIFQLPTR